MNLLSSLQHEKVTLELEKVSLLEGEGEGEGVVGDTFTVCNI